MQVYLKDYDEQRHEMFYALRVPREWADKLTKINWRDDKGDFHAEVETWIQDLKPSYRGDILIVACSAEKGGELSPCEVVGLVELYDVIPSDLVTGDIAQGAGYVGKAPSATGSALLFRDPRRVVELPCRMTRDWQRVIYPKGEITPYPRVLAMGKKFWKNLLLWKRK